MADSDLSLQLLPESLAVCRLHRMAPIPDWASAGDLVSITRTRDELSIVCPQWCVPDEVQSEAAWRCLCVEGPLDFGLTGILSSLALPLANAGISIFAISTYDTDYLLVKEHRLAQAVAVLRMAGHVITEK